MCSDEATPWNVSLVCDREPPVGTFCIALWVRILRMNGYLYYVCSIRICFELYEVEANTQWNMLLFEDKSWQCNLRSLHHNVQLRWEWRQVPTWYWFSIRRLSWYVADMLTVYQISFPSKTYCFGNFCDTQLGNGVT